MLPDQDYPGAAWKMELQIHLTFSVPTHSYSGFVLCNLISVRQYFLFVRQSCTKYFTSFGRFSQHLCVSQICCCWMNFGDQHKGLTNVNHISLFSQMQSLPSSCATQCTTATHSWCRTPGGGCWRADTRSPCCCCTHSVAGPKRTMCRWTGAWSSMPLFLRMVC